MYGLCVIAGMLLSWLVVRSLNQGTAKADPRIQLAAVFGAGLGAHAAHIVPTALGWLSPGPATSPVDGFEALYGRSIFGGLLGGWGAVEWAKRHLRISSSVGATFAAPLAVALGFGRLGCFLEGCCGGIVYDGALAMTDPHGVTRFPVQLFEVVFHTLAFAVLYTRARTGRASELDLVGYFALYAGVRFALEEVRWHGEFLAGLTFYQWLSLVLGTFAGSLFIRRMWKRREATRADAEGASVLAVPRPSKRLPPTLEDLS